MEGTAQAVPCGRTWNKISDWRLAGLYGCSKEEALFSDLCYSYVEDSLTP